MTEFGPGSDRVEPGKGKSTRDEQRIAQLLTELADDPDAPPSSVTAMSVIAAAKAAASAEVIAAPGERPMTSDDHPEPGGPGRTADLIEFRPRRRRFALAGLVAAAAIAGISVLGISLTVSGGSSTSTSADGARAAGAEGPSSGQLPAAEIAVPPAAPGPAAGSNPLGDVAAAGAAPATSAAAAASAAGSGFAADSAATGCWPALSDRALAALTDVLPPDAFGSPLPLTADCDQGAIGGVILPGTAQGTALVVRVSAAAPGACVSDTSGGTACLAKGDDLYVASDAAGSPVVYAYGAGNQVVVSGWPASGDSVAVASGLTVEQSVSAAEAVLGAVG